jgi:predicted alpha-1,2-mannosidase
MKRAILYLSAVIIIAITFFSCTSKKDNIDYVNPFIGTGGHGHTFPGPTLPFGMIQLGPDTRLTGWDGCSGYHYSDSIIYGFSHTHLSGTGVGDYCDILFMPTVGKPEFVSGYINEYEKTNTGYGSVFQKKNEEASVGYYSVFLDDYAIKAELTSSLRCGIHQYTFPESDSSNIIIDLTHRDAVIHSDIEFLSDTEIWGSRISNSWAKEQYIYFYAQFSKAFKDHGILINDSLHRNINSAEGENIKAYVSYKTGENEMINVKVGLSAVSKDGAKKNFEAEIKERYFDHIKTAAQEKWEHELNKIQVKGGTKKQKTIFYTSLYHSFIAPNLFQDVDGLYRGTDLKIHQANDFTNYTVFSLWDTYRATHPLYTIVQQKRTSDFIRTFLNQYEKGGQLPVWELAANYTGCMIGYHSIPVIADAYLKGIIDYDINKAFEAMKHSAETDHLGIDEFRKYGFIPANMEHESVSKALEYAYDDWCIAQMAKALNQDEDFKYFIQRAQYYKNHFEPKTGFMRAKKDATWMEPFDPKEVNFNFTEANSWQYSFYVPQDITGFTNLLGGNEALDQKLDELFSETTETTGRGQSDITGLIGQYAHGNEPSHHMAYLYNYAGKAWKTQKKVRQIMDQMYSDEPDGLIGNEDCGQMSSWYVLSAMGFYPVTPGLDYYTIGSPLFKEVKINLENGKSFTIKANNASRKYIYIQSTTLNGKEYPFSYLKHKDIIHGGELNFTMGSNPNEDWGNKPDELPKSEIKEHLITPAPYVYAEQTSFTDSLTFTIESTDKNAAIFYIINQNSEAINYRQYKDPLTIHETTTIHFYAESENKNRSKTMSAFFYKLPEGISIKLATEYAPQYAAGGNNALIDGITGSNDFRIGSWQGYQEVDLDATISFENEKLISELSVRFLQDINSWIFMPEEVEFLISNDGINFRSAGTVKNKIPDDSWDIEIEDFSLNLKKTKAKYIKIIGKNMGRCPKGHKAAGYKAWIFADEIMIN